MHAWLPDTNGSDNSIPMAYLTLDHQLQVKEHAWLVLLGECVVFTVFSCPFLYALKNQLQNQSKINGFARHGAST